MATKESIAIVRETALHSLKDNSAQIAALMDIEPPNLEMYFHDKDLQQAEELKALAGFNERVIAALQTKKSKSKAGVT